MATETIVPSAPAAPAAASAPAPAASPAPAAAPASAPVTAPAAAVPATESAKPAIDPSKLDTYAYADALVKEKLAKIAETKPAEDAVEAPPVEVPAPEVAAPDAETASEKPVEAAPEQAVEEDFQLDPEPPVTPEALSQLVKDNPEFGALLEADPKLKGQLYKTAREAAELKPYRELFADLDLAKAAHQSAATWTDVRDTFLGSATKDGTMKTLGKMAELCFERNENGELVTDAEGDPVIGNDFYGFVDNVVGIDLETRSAEVDARLQSNAYGSQEERDRDESVKAALDILRENLIDQQAADQSPAAVQKRIETAEQRANAAEERDRTAKQQERATFERGLQQEGIKRTKDGIASILANVEKQGGVISPYLKEILPRVIGDKLVQKISQNQSLQAQMRELQKLPMGDSSRQRRIAAIDRAIQLYLPDVVREELRQAGVQVKAAADAKSAKMTAQIDATKKTEMKGAAAPSNRAATTMSAKDADAQAKTEWQRAHPGRPFDRAAQTEILPRILQLMKA